jgi:hypothetical protein
VHIHVRRLRVSSRGCMRGVLGRHGVHIDIYVGIFYKMYIYIYEWCNSMWRLIERMIERWRRDWVGVGERGARERESRTIG